MTIPATQDITITRGDSFDMLVTVRQNGTPVDLTDATVSGEIRETADSPDPALCTFVCVKADQGTNPGQVVCSLDKTETAALTIASGVYDLQLDWATSGNRETFVGGTVTVRKDVTK